MSYVQYAIAKAERAEQQQKRYREALFAGVNPRSETEVAEGSAGRRTARVVGGTLAGSVVGAAGAASLARIPPAAIAAGLAGPAIGTSLGRTANIKSGDVRARRRSDGKEAKGAFSLTGIVPVHAWNY